MNQQLERPFKAAVKGTALIAAGMAVNTALWFSIKVLLIRILPPDEFGIYTLTATIIGAASTMAVLGVNEAAARFISVLLSEGKTREADMAASSAVRIALISGAVFTLLIIGSSAFMAKHVFYKPGLLAPLRLMSLVVLPTVLSAVIANIMRGRGAVGPKVAFIDIGHPAAFGALAAMVVFTGPTLTGVINAFSISAGLMLVSITVYAVKKNAVSMETLKSSGGMNVEILRFSMPLFIGALLHLVLSWTDTLMLGRYAGASDVAVYNAASTLGRMLTFPLNALSFVFLPLASEMIGKGKTHELKRTYQVLTKWVFSITLPGFFVLFFFPEMTITFLFGKGFLDAAMPLRLLAVCFMLQCFFGANAILLMAMGRTRVFMNISAIGAILNVLLNYLLIKHAAMGIMGAAIATFAAYSISIGLIAAVLYKENGLQPFTVKYLRPLIGTSIIAVLIYALAKSIPLYMWMMPVYLLLFIAGYAFSIIVTRSIDGEDVALMRAVSEKTGMVPKTLMRLLERME